MSHTNTCGSKYFWIVGSPRQFSEALSSPASCRHPPIAEDVANVVISTRNEVIRDFILLIKLSDKNRPVSALDDL